MHHDSLLKDNLSIQVVNFLAILKSVLDIMIICYDFVKPD